VGAIRVVPDQDDIRLAAYHRWERLGRRLGLDQEDWFESEVDLLFKLNYHILFACKLDVGEKIYIGDPSSRRCRYCGGTAPTASFRKEAHALPELVGNRVLIALDECDCCNEFFGRTLEDHLSKFTLPFRAGLAISGKKGVPSYKTANKRSRMDYDPTGRRFSILDRQDCHILVRDESSKTLTLSLDSQPYIPVAVFKCLTKMALAMMPPQEFRLCRGAVGWIRNPEHGSDPSYLEGLGCYLYFSPRPFPQAWASLLRRSELDAPVPHMLFLVGTAHLLLQICVPFCERDGHLVGKSVTVPKFDLASAPGFEGTNCQVVPLSSCELTRSTKLTLTFTYETHKEIDEHDWPFRTSWTTSEP
jgi:hypothetical protein